MAASRMMMINQSKTSLQCLIRRHLRPADAAAQLMINTAAKSSAFAPSEASWFEKRGTEDDLVRLPFGFFAEHFLDRCRIEVQGRPINADDDSKDDSGDDEPSSGDEGFVEDFVDDSESDEDYSGDDEDLRKRDY